MPGTPDSTFNLNGIYQYDFGFQDNLTDVKIQPDQKIVCTGVALNTSFMGALKVVRLNTNGSLDSTFATNGIFTYVITSETYGVESYVRSDGKIIVAGLAAITFGYYDFLLLRLNANGIIDSTFGTNGSTVISISDRDDLAQALTVQNDGKILLSGTITDTINYYNNPSIVRFTENGFVDSTFGLNGVAIIAAVDIDNELTSIAVQNDGKIVASGHYSKVFTGAMDFDVLLIRLDTNGIPDGSFGNNGIVKTSINGGIDDSYGLAMDAAQNIFVCGFTTLPFTLTLDMILLKYDNTGTLDPGFGTGGITTFNNADEDVAYDLKIQPDNKIVVGGGSGIGFFGPRPVALWRYLSNGTVDSTFGTNGFVTTLVNPDFQDINSLALQGDGKIVGVGKTHNGVQNDIMVLRYLGDLSSSVYEISGDNPIIISPNPVSAGEELTITFAKNGASQKQIILIDILGKKIVSTSSDIKPYSKIRIPPTLSRGMYILTISEDKALFKQKIIVR